MSQVYNTKLIEIKGKRIRKLLGVVGILSRLGNVENTSFGFAKLVCTKL